MNQKWQRAGQKVKPGLKWAGRLALLSALRYGPAGVAGWAIKSVARRPLKMLPEAVPDALQPCRQTPCYNPFITKHFRAQPDGDEAT